MGVVLGGIGGLMLVGLVVLSFLTGAHQLEAPRFERSGETWKYTGPSRLKDWQVFVYVNGRRVVCENPTVWDTEVISCDEIVTIDDGEKGPSAAPKKMAEAAVPIPMVFEVDTGPDEHLRARLREIDEGLRGPKNP